MASVNPCCLVGVSAKDPLGAVGSASAQARREGCMTAAIAKLELQNYARAKGWLEARCHVRGYSCLF